MIFNLKKVTNYNQFKILFALKVYFYLHVKKVLTPPSPKLRAQHRNCNRDKPDNARIIVR